MPYVIISLVSVEKYAKEKSFCAILFIVEKWHRLLTFLIFLNLESILMNIYTFYMAFKSLEKINKNIVY